MSPVYDKGGGKTLLWNDFDIWWRVCFHCNKIHHKLSRMCKMVITINSLTRHCGYGVMFITVWDQTAGTSQQESINIAVLCKPYSYNTTTFNLPNQPASFFRCSDSIFPSLLCASTQMSSVIWLGKTSRETLVLFSCVSPLKIRLMLTKDFNTNQRNSTARPTQPVFPLHCMYRAGGIPGQREV